MIWLALIVITPRAVIIPIAMGQGVFWEPFLATDRQTVTSRNPGVGTHWWATSNSHGGEGVLGALYSWAGCIQPRADKSALGFLKGRGLPCNHCRLGWVQHFFPSGEFRALPLLDWFLWGLLDSLFLRGGSGCSHHARRLSLLNWAGWHSLWRIYTFKDFPVWKGEVTLHLLPQLLHTFGQPAWLTPVGRSDFST